jgi:hypothetical protein
MMKQTRKSESHSAQYRQLTHLERYGLVSSIVLVAYNRKLSESLIYA